jgi:hypothetical protein
MSDTRCDACAANEALIIALDQRVQTMEHSCVRMKEAFVKNDLGLPDYDGHRTDHKLRREETQVVEGYKKDVTKSILIAIALFVAGLMSSGLKEWLGTHIK